MKKFLVVAMIIVFGGLLSTAAVAAWTKGQGPGPDSQVDVNAFRNFQKKTLPLRDEMAVKRVELRNEFNKADPDQNKIATLQKEMIDLRTISAAAKKNGLSSLGISTSKLMSTPCPASFRISFGCHKDPQGRP